MNRRTVLMSEEYVKELKEKLIKKGHTEHEAEKIAKVTAEKLRSYNASKFENRQSISPTNAQIVPAKPQQSPLKKDETVMLIQSQGDEYVDGLSEGMKSYDTKTFLMQIAKKLGLFYELGEIGLLGNRIYVTKAGLVRMAHANNVLSIITEPVFEDDEKHVYKFKCTATFPPIEEYPSECRVFVGHGDAKPASVTRIVRDKDSIRRMAETRAIGRCLRTALCIGIPVKEELESVDQRDEDA